VQTHRNASARVFCRRSSNGEQVEQKRKSFEAEVKTEARTRHGNGKNVNRETRNP